MITRADLRTLRDEIHRNAVDHGWWEGGVEKRNFREILLLIVGEVSELHEAFRHNLRMFE
jgi:NTP pyrophosphatase (non-canonical NTP hydrolase)